MDNRGLDILLVSSESLARRSSRLAFDQYMALKSNGHRVDVLTRYDDSGNPDVLSVLDKEPSAVQSQGLLARVLAKIKAMSKPRQSDARDYYFFYQREDNPPVEIDRVLAKITKHYDMVLVTFWQGLLSAQTVWELHRHTNLVPMLFVSVDMSTLTGGCHYFWDCMRYETGCGRCPGIGSDNPNDFTHFNSQYRHDHFSKMNCVFLGNGYTNALARRSYALQGVAIEQGYLSINEEEFCPRSKVALRSELGISIDKQFVLFAGSQALADSRKGMPLLVEALHLFYDSLDPTKRSQVLVLLAGVAPTELIDAIPFDVLSLGFVGFDVLPKAYAAADLFLSPSVLDAGPMMVNQALSCGTPVVAFEMGTALEVVKDQGTGYCAQLGDAVDFSNGIAYIYALGNEQKSAMNARCRQMAMESSSYGNFAHSIQQVYDLISTKQ